MPLEFKFPDVGEGITEGEIVKWLVKEGDRVSEHQPLAEIETDKAIVEIPSPKAGTIQKIYHKEGDTVKVGEVLVTILETGEKAASQVKKPEVKPAGVVGYLEEAPEEIKEEVKTVQKLQEELRTEIQIQATPATRRLAKELGIDLTNVKGTGKEGRITEEDVRNFAQRQQVEVKTEAIVKARKYDLYGYIETIPLRGVRKAVAKKMKESVSHIPHVIHMDEADVTKLWELREREKKIAEMKGIHLTFLPFIVKAVIAGLREHPYINSSLDEEHEQIILKKYYNIGIAVDTQDGLIVPVIKIADEKSILDIAKEISDLSDRAKKRQLDLAELKGGTFTITNIGSVRGFFATPIINYPESAILALGRIFDRLVIEDRKVVPKKILPMSLAFDHRILDGAEAARFMQTVIEHLEDPDLVLIERD